MFELVLYDTSDFESFPIGGQLTSIRNFLRYIAEYQTEYVEKILLVGITTNQTLVGKFCTVTVSGKNFAYLPVLYREADLSSVQKSLRVAYVKALFRYNKMLPYGKKVTHYIHTPEAYIPVKILHPHARAVVFSHGSFFNMLAGFRFFRKNKLVTATFELFVILLLKTANLIFVLDDESERQYRKYTRKICRVENSIVLPMDLQERSACHNPLRLLYVGRLSKVKRVDQLILAMEHLGTAAKLNIVGDGEERITLEELVRKRNLGDRVKFLGSCTPDQIKEYYCDNDILVLNSVLEGKPMVILEALSYGLPVVTTPVGGIPELVSNGIEAEFTDGSIKVFVEKMGYIGLRYLDYSNNARKSAQKYSFVQVNKTVFDYLRI